MDALVALTPSPTQRQVRVGWIATFGAACSGALAAFAGAPAHAVVVALGLGALAVTDWADHRLPAKIVQATALLFVVTAVGHAIVESDGSATARGALAGFGIAAALGFFWLVLPGAVAFGDVKMTTLASAAAAACSWRALTVLLLAAPVGAAAIALANRSRSVRRPDDMVPLAPSLALAFVLGVLAA